MRMLSNTRKAHVMGGAHELLPYEAHCSIESGRICWRLAFPTLSLQQVQVVPCCCQSGEGVKLWKSGQKEEKLEYLAA